MNIPDPLFFDSFLFNGEDIVKMRLAYLNPYVDRFYITESIYTFSGKKKDEFYVDRCSEWFAPYADKIRIVKIYEYLTEITEGYPTGIEYVDTMLSKYDSFKEEKAQRNYARKEILSEYAPPQKYIVAFSDVDEFYDLRTLGSKKIVWQACQDHIVFFKQKGYMFNFIYEQGDDICVALLMSSEMLEKQGDIDHIRAHKFGEKSIVIQSGWHFSYFMSAGEVQRKLGSYAHTENNKEEYNTPNYIDTMIVNGQDLFMRSNFALKHVPYSSTFPEVFYTYFLELLKLQGISYTVSKTQGYASPT